jgi:spore maturation protein CgeB
MKIVIFGLTVSSSWGNGHATLWRGLIRALVRRGSSVTFFERNVPYYAATRDLHEMPGAALVFFDDWTEVEDRARRAVRSADVAMVTSYCPDGLAASELVAEAASGVSVFYDLDTPVTLARLSGGEQVGYIGLRGLRDFDLVLSFTGGAALGELRHRLGACRVAPLYGHVDPDVHRPTGPQSQYVADLSYLGTYAGDRQAQLAALFIAPAALCPHQRFVIGGAQYPQDFPWHPNIFFVRHLPPGEHPAFYASSRLTLNVTRSAMARMGWCPSGRLFEAAACGTSVISDEWQGIESFYSPGKEILLARSPGDIVAALGRSESDIRRIGRAARERTLAEHTSDHRAGEFLQLIEQARRPSEPALASQGP